MHLWEGGTSHRVTWLARGLKSQSDLDGLRTGLPAAVSRQVRCRRHGPVACAATATPWCGKKTIVASCSPCHHVCGHWYVAWAQVTELLRRVFGSPGGDDAEGGGDDAGGGGKKGGKKGAAAKKHKAAADAQPPVPLEAALRCLRVDLRPEERFSAAAAMELLADRKAGGGAAMPSALAGERSRARLGALSRESLAVYKSRQHARRCSRNLQGNEL